jgi:hypothetical protein
LRWCGCCAVPGGCAAGRAEDRVAADQRGLVGGEDEGRDFRPAGHGGLVEAVAAVDQQRPARLAAGAGQGGEDDRLVGGRWSWRIQG